MSKFFNDTMRSLTQAIEIEKGNVPLTERKGMAAPTYYVGENDRKGSDTMPFVKVNVEEEIQKRRESDPGFRDVWDSSREEYKRIGEEIAKEKISPRGTTWDELEKELFSPEEIEESNVRVAIVNEMIRAREEDGITQKQLEEMSGVKQPVISRMEKGATDPQLSTVLRILNSLGKTLKVVPLK